MQYEGLYYLFVSWFLVHKNWTYNPTPRIKDVIDDDDNVNINKNAAADDDDEGLDYDDDEGGESQRLATVGSAHW